MILMPALDLMGGHVVQLVGGQRDTEQIDLPDPLAVVDGWAAQGAEWLHVVDLDAAFGQNDNRAIVERILADGRLRVEVGGGIRTEDQLKAYLDAGAERVVVGTKALRDPLWLQTMARRYPGRIVLAADARNGSVVAHGWLKDTGRDLLDVVRRANGLPLAGLLYTAVHLEGRLSGIDRPGVRRLRAATRLPLVASGGITTLEDVRFLFEAGVEAAVLGLALYTGRITFRDAQRMAEATPS